MPDDSPQLLAEINSEQLALIDQLDTRQDEVLLQLDVLTQRIEQIIELYAQNRKLEKEVEEQVQRHAA